MSGRRKTKRSGRRKTKELEAFCFLAVGELEALLFMLYSFLSLLF